MPTWSMHWATRAGVRSRLTPSASTTSADPQRLETERLPCLATLRPAPATTNAVAVETLKVPDASPPVPAVSISISRSVPARAVPTSPRVRTRTALSRMTSARPISSSTVSPFMRSAVRKAATWTEVAAPDMSASIAAAASSRVRSRRSTRVRIASTMTGLVMSRPFLLSGSAGSPDARHDVLDVLVPEGLRHHPVDPVRLQLIGLDLDPPTGHEDHWDLGPRRLDGLRDLPPGHPGHREVGHDHVERALAEPCQAGDPVVGDDHVVVLLAKHLAQRVPHEGLVVDDQHPHHLTAGRGRGRDRSEGPPSHRQPDGEGRA